MAQLATEKQYAGWQSEDQAIEALLGRIGSVPNDDKSRVIFDIIQRLDIDFPPSTPPVSGQVVVKAQTPNLYMTRMGQWG